MYENRRFRRFILQRCENKNFPERFFVRKRETKFFDRERVQECLLGNFSSESAKKILFEAIVQEKTRKKII